VRLQVLTAVLLKIAVFWGVMLYHWVNIYWAVNGLQCLHVWRQVIQMHCLMLMIPTEVPVGVSVFNLWSVVYLHGLLHAAIYLNTGAGHAALHTAISRNLVDSERVAFWAFCLHNIVSSWDSIATLLYQHIPRFTFNTNLHTLKT